MKTLAFKCRILVNYYEHTYINGRAKMKKIRGRKFLVLAAFVLSMLLITGCGEDKSGNTINEPEITVDYLTEEYAQQLKTDGAETLMGFVELEKNDDGSYSVHIEEQEVVPNSGYEEGYYIADTNVAKDATLGDDARMTCIVDDEIQVVDADDFINSGSNGGEQLYSVYFMGDSAELILAVDPETVIPEQ